MNVERHMYAAVLKSYGAPFLLTRIVRPEPGPGQVLVRIHASGVNPLDAKIRQGQAGHAQQPLPAVLGLDLAGVVAATGPGVSGFRVGDEVYGMTGGVGGLQGSLAEFAAVDARLLAHKPRNLGMREAAVMPLVFITAWEGLIDRAALKSGQRVLVQGGGGGVGHMAVQIAHAFGAEVFATESPAKRGYIEQLGATFIDYTTATVSDYVAEYTAGRGFDVVYDTGGGAVLDASFEAVARFGHVVSSLGWGTHALAPLSFKAATYSGVFTLHPLLSGDGLAHYGRILTRATALVESGAVRPRLDPGHFTLDTIDAAHRALESRDTAGKIAVDVLAGVASRERPENVPDAA